MPFWRRRGEEPGDVDLGELNDGKRGWFRRGGCYVYRVGRVTAYAKAYRVLRVGGRGALLRVRDLLFTNWRGWSELLLTGLMPHECDFIADRLRLYGWELTPADEFRVPTRLRLMKRIYCPVVGFSRLALVWASRREGSGPARALARYLAKYPSAPERGELAAAAWEIAANNCYFKLSIALYEPGYRPNVKLARKLSMGFAKSYNVSPSQLYRVLKGMYVPMAPEPSRPASGPVLHLSSSHAFHLGDAGHALFIGSTGTGKSLAACYLAWQLAERGTPVLVIDVTGQYAHALGGRGFRIYELGYDYAVDLLELPVDAITEIPVYLMGSGAWTTPIQRSIAERVMTEVGAKGGTLFDVYRRLLELEMGAERRSDESSAAAAARRRLEPLAKVRGLSGEALEHAARGLDLEYPCVIKLNRLPEWESIAASALALLYSVLYTALWGGFRARSLVVLLDEAHRVFQFRPAREHVVSRMCAELRKYGVKVWLVTQSLAGLPAQVLANIHHLFAFRPEVEDAEWLARRLRLSSEYVGGLDPVDALLSLGVGECFAQHGPGRAARVRVEVPAQLVERWKSWRPELPKWELVLKSPYLEAKRVIKELERKRIEEAKRKVSKLALELLKTSKLMAGERALLEEVARRPELAAKLYALESGLILRDRELLERGLAKEIGEGVFKLSRKADKVLKLLVEKAKEELEKLAQALK
ncbi:MAG: hypothetical protein DRJ57_03045 [Thermoprotei archaeon]|nr:MAG: hypothetical protein DRJ57_03045 [Thermoprotei archaeon]